MLREVPEGWSLTTIGAICNIVRGGSPRPIDKFMTDDENGVNWIKIGDASASSKYIYSTKEKIKPEGEKKSRRVKSGDFLLSNSMSFGRPYILRIDGCIHDGWLSLSFDRTQLWEEFLYYLLSSPLVFRQFENKAAGSAVKNLNKELVSSVSVMLPSFTEQKRIAETLGSVDTSIETTRAVIGQAERVKRGLMEELLTGGLGNEAIGRGEVPEGWQIKRLGDFCIPKQHPTVQKNKFTESGYPVYGANGQIGFYKAYTHKDRTIAITCRGATCGTINVVPPRSYITGNAMALDELNEDIITFDYLQQYLLNFGVEQCITGSAQPQITRTALLLVNLVFPPLSEQKRIAEILGSFDDFIAKQKAIIEQQARIKKGLMDDLLTGRVRTV